MAGYDLNEETYIDKNLTDDELWSVFSGIFSNKVVHDTSYKYGFYGGNFKWYMFKMW